MQREIKCEWCNAIPAEWNDLGGSNLCRLCAQAVALKAQRPLRNSDPVGPLSTLTRRL